MIRSILLVAALLITMAGVAQNKISIIPQPVFLESGKREFNLLPTTTIEITNPSLQSLAEYLGKKLNTPTGYTIKVRQVSNFSDGNIHLHLNGIASNNKEGYELTASEKNIVIGADSAAGIFYGIQTLFQLLPEQIVSRKKVDHTKWNVPAVMIRDEPRFGWRGAMLDVARHFFTKQEVKDFIDDVASYKFNVLHLHLTDDQGWRLEIKSLPKLTEVGAWRAERLGKWGNTSKPAPNEPKTYGGFYTQDDMRELIQYAKERHMSILPEVDVPGHSLATVASYPDLSCTPGTYHVGVGDKILNWHSKGYTALLDNTLCPANEKVYTFLDKVFTEMAELFPFEYIHMGGDECAKDFWINNPAIKALMQKENLKDMHAVQSYFVKRVEKILKSKGKKLIGWDEIMDGGLPADATVMSWRGMRNGIKAAKLGHKVVMSPATHAYYDLYQGDPVAEPPTYSMVRLRDSYRFDPVPEGVDEKLILGGQGNLWTEQIQNMRHAQYMLYPRTLAVAESVWSPVKHKNWNNFIAKVEREFLRMDQAGIKYSRSMYDPIFKVTRDAGNLKLDLSTEVEGLDIHYSYDGSDPDNFYPKYSKPLIVPKDAMDVKVVTYKNGKLAGKFIRMPVTELEKRAGKK